MSRIIFIIYVSLCVPKMTLGTTKNLFPWTECFYDFSHVVYRLHTYEKEVLHS